MLTVGELIIFTVLIEFNYLNANVIGDRRLGVKNTVDVVEHHGFGDDDRW